MTHEAAIARANAIPLEVKKDGLVQRSDGSWVVRFRIHPNDMRPELAQAAMGSRWMMALVEINEDETPVQRNAAGERLVQRAGILCSDRQFQNFLRTEWPMNWEQSEGSEQDRAAIVLRGICEVQSRKEFATNAKATAAFENVTAKYEGWKRGMD